jgi:hypothetical protein
MPSTADSSKNSGPRGGADRVLNIAYIGTSRDNAWRASYHSIPDGPGVFVSGLAGTQQIAFESRVERRVNFFAGFDHFALPFRMSLFHTNEAFC